MTTNMNRFESKGSELVFHIIVSVSIGFSLYFLVNHYQIWDFTTQKETNLTIFVDLKAGKLNFILKKWLTKSLFWYYLSKYELPII